MLDTLFAFRGLHPAIAQRDVDIVEQIQIRDQVETLENEADLAIADLRSVRIAQTAYVFAIGWARRRTNAFSVSPRSPTTQAI